MENQKTMLNGVHFYHATIKRIVSVFGTIFNNIVVGRHSGNTISNIQRVPISYGPRNKFLDRMKENLEQQRVAIKLPRMSFEITSIDYDPSTKLNRLNKTLHTISNSPNSRNSMYQSVPYTLGMQLNIMARNQEDALQIVEQILPTFSPEYTVTIKGIEGPGSLTDVPFILNSVTFQDDYESDVATRRTIIYTLDFTVRIRFAPDTSRVSIIKKVETEIADFTSVAVGSADTLSSVQVSQDSPAGPIDVFTSLFDTDNQHTANLVVNSLSVTGITPLNDINSVSISSGTTDLDRIDEDNTNINISSLSAIGGTGSGARFDVIIDGRTGITTSVTTSLAGLEFIAGDSLSISDSPYHNTNLVLSVDTIDSTEAILYDITDLDGDISGVDANLSIQKDDTVYSINSIISGGTGFAENEIITILGTSLGGATPANDASVTVTTVDGGEITAASISGTAIAQGSIDTFTVTSGDAANADTIADYNPTFTRNISVDGGSGSGLSLDIDLDKTGSVTDIRIVDGGVDYLSTDQITITAAQLGEIDSPSNSPTTPLVIDVDSVNETIISGNFIRNGKVNGRPKFDLNSPAGGSNSPNAVVTIEYSGDEWQLLRGDTLISDNVNDVVNPVIDGWNIRIGGREETPIVTSTDAQNFTPGEVVTGNITLGRATIVSSADNVIVVNELESKYVENEVLTGLTSGITRTIFDMTINE